LIFSDYRRAKLKNSFNVWHYFCNFIKCDFKCISKQKIENHVKGTHLNKKLLNCIKFYQEFWTYISQSKHIRENHKELFDEKTQTFKCDFSECKLNLRFNKYSTLLLHRIRHFSDKTFKCSDEYPFCESIFFTNAELRNHKLYCHKTNRPYVCDREDCGQKFMRKKQLGIDSFRYFFSFLANFIDTNFLVLLLFQNYINFFTAHKINPSIVKNVINNF
jgi:hypothetical protein